MKIIYNFTAFLLGLLLAYYVTAPDAKPGKANQHFELQRITK